MSGGTKSVFQIEEFKPLAGLYERRKRLYGNYWKYYKAEVYKPSGMGGSELGQYTQQRIANATRPLFTPLARAVNLDVALIPGGWAIVPAASELQGAVEALFEASAWEVEGDIYTRFTVAMGEAGLLVVDDREQNQVSLQVLRPDRYVVERMGRYDARPKRLVFIEMEHGGDELATVIDPDLIRTYRNGEPEGFEGRPPAYVNGLGFVPFAAAVDDPGDGEGEPTFDDVIASLDEVNQQATHLSNIIRKHVEPQWAAIGAEAGDLTKSGDTVWFFPEGSDIKAVLAEVDFDGFLAFIKEIKEEVKEGLPELAFAKLAGLERIASATIELQMAEAVCKIRRLRKPVDYGLRQAMRLAGRAAAAMGLHELAVLDSPVLKLDVGRPVISIDALTRLQIDQATTSKELQSLALERERALLSGDENG
ncbi:MAG: hypothetical protein KJ063_02465 [Anaerolineae bacterium]|nr:hypothetical protein [Anaerolineae bacterium]